jgi:predicted RNA binding protein YcfA (HicA-like mRNA interferase family)
MPRKIRQLKADLRRAGFRQVKERGKGNHSMWRHPLVPDLVTLSGSDGDDAQYYEERMVRDFIERADKAMADKAADEEAGGQQA